MNPELIVFDCDGVLVDSEIIAIEIESRLLTEAGFPMSTDDVAETCVGLSNEDIVEKLKQRFGRPIPASLNAKMQADALAAFPDHLKPVPGIAKLLSESQTPRCVASSSNPARIQLSLTVTDLVGFFDQGRLFSATMVENGKPAPDLFLHAARSIGHAPEDCLVIEDSPHGVSAAKAAGMDVIGFVGGGHARPVLTDRLRAAGAEMVVDSHQALGEVLAAVI